MDPNNDAQKVVNPAATQQKRTQVIFPSFDETKISDQQAYEIKRQMAAVGSRSALIMGVATVVGKFYLLYSLGSLLNLRWMKLTTSASKMLYRNICLFFLPKACATAYIYHANYKMVIRYSEAFNKQKKEETLSQQSPLYIMDPNKTVASDKTSF